MILSFLSAFLEKKKNTKNPKQRQKPNEEKTQPSQQCTVILFLTCWPLSLLQLATPTSALPGRWEEHKAPTS